MVFCMTSKIKKVCSVIGSVVLLFVALFCVVLLPVFFGVAGLCIGIGFVLLFLCSVGVVVSQYTTPKFLKPLYTSLWISGLALIVLTIAVLGCIKLSSYAASLAHPETASITQPVATATPAAPTSAPTVKPADNDQGQSQPASHHSSKSTHKKVDNTQAKKAADKIIADAKVKAKAITDQAQADANAKRIADKAAADKAAAEKLAAQNEAKKLADAKAKQEAIDALAKAKQPSWYDDTSKHSVTTYTWNLKVNSCDYGMISGVFVKITNSSGNVVFDNTNQQSQGVYIKKLLPGNYTVTVTDGFVLTINQNYVDEEWNARIKQAEANNWARNFIKVDPLS